MIKDAIATSAESIIDDSIGEIRNIAHNLMPKSLSSKGLINALTDYFDNLQQVYHKEVEFSHDIQVVFTPDLQINLYRIISELVLNAAKHSNARMISITIKTMETIIFLQIKDNGQGFLSKPDELQKSMGLQNITDRLWYLQGTFTLQSLPDKGTAIDIIIPLQGNLFLQPEHAQAHSL